MRAYLLIFILVLNTSCRTLGSFSSFPYSVPSHYGSNLSNSSNSTDDTHKRYLPNVTIREPYEVEGCRSIGNRIANDEIESFQREGDRIKADSMVFFDNATNRKAEYYDCRDKFASYRSEWIDSKSSSDLSLFAGRYVQRDGILKKLGRMGPTLGIEYARFKDNDSPHGFFLAWTFDHFWKTSPKLLKQSFKDQDYTNYMAGGGYAFRYSFGERVQFHYRGGIALNFIEIDTFRSNGDQDDGRYSDVTLSTVHKISFDYLIGKIDQRKLFARPQIRIGPALYYYWAPDPLGKFRLTDEKNSETQGGSMSLLINAVFEFY